MIRQEMCSLVDCICLDADCETFDIDAFAGVPVGEDTFEAADTIVNRSEDPILPGG